MKNRTALILALLIVGWSAPRIGPMVWTQTTDFLFGGAGPTAAGQIPISTAASGNAVIQWQLATRLSVAGGTNVITTVASNQEIGARAPSPLAGTITGICCQVEVAGTTSGNFTTGVRNTTTSVNAPGQSQACTTAAGTKFCYWPTDGGLLLPDAGKGTETTAAADLFVPAITTSSCSTTNPELACSAFVTY